MSLLSFFKSQGSTKIDAISMSVIPAFASKDYLAFGSLIKPYSNRVYWIGRNGTGHEVGGVISKIEYDINSKKIIQSVTIIDEQPTNGFSNGTALIIDGSIYIFDTKYDGVDYQGLGYYKSTDGLVGETYGTFNDLSSFLTYTRYNTFGVARQIDSSTYIVPWFEHTGGDPYRQNFLKTVDSGNNWTNHLISETAAPNEISETDILHLGGNELLAVGRKESSNYILQQNYSSDLGATWGGWQQTNLGSGVQRANANMIINSAGLIDLIYMDRGTGDVLISKNNALTVKSNPTAWNTSVLLLSVTGDTAYNPLGYPNILEISNGRYFCTTSKDTDPQAVAEMYYGDGHLDSL